MTPFKTLTGIVAPLDRSDVDTDQIIPKQFLKRVERSGFGEFLFYDWRRLENGQPNPGFALNQSRYQGANVLLARDNFGCGSSREHAPWALQDFGLSVIIAPSFADIFKTNCFKNGMLPVELEATQVDDWFQRVFAREGYTITADLEAQTLEGSDGFRCAFDIDAFRKRCLLEGLDDIDLTLEHVEKIGAYERAHGEPWQAAVSAHQPQKDNR